MRKAVMNVCVLGFLRVCFHVLETTRKRATGLISVLLNPF